ncbi:hemolysin/magnesium/cobalt transporter CorC/HlyC [Neoasaia chiangmaiensis NBRC 101099]|uniref:Magnesium/cobalt efflux protein n=1 Tax=Neoasaia chiangmaiensis TaxID=320497 RepID=A0A1U9KN86_9PROT|nr:hemolysin family protein [Neoasaia chiangmaiensis]AQS87249.1 magnesium/cobalt efflux protein [Neoasaia chiangmaiensis]GBR38454.1 hemolysin/magnesium/cobalt transporter CorC/HlyC [Neoasaia chiangmaiensis NBRC 101099]GEN15889.1 hemolysin C [Neoasaia chiangmaiensis]
MSDSDDARNRSKGLFGFLGRRREHGLRHSIAALVQEAATPNAETGAKPELDRQERALITNVLHLREITADDVMVPRADIVAMPLSITLAEALDFMRRENHSRVPVYREHLDDIVGMIHVKDLIAYVGTSDAFSLGPLLRQPLMVAPQIPVLDLLLQMRQRRMHLALVIDEYGGIDGLVTIEDLVETIVGDISDEHDEPVTAMMTQRPDGSFDIDARMPVEEFEARMGAVLTDAETEAEIETVGGLVFHLAGHVPTRGEVFTHESGLVFRVTDADARHIRSLRMRVPEGWEKRDRIVAADARDDH